ncbi:MAG: hypothetical protein ACFCGT_08320 [Sandaracinaceae bacterium]
MTERRLTAAFVPFIVALALSLAACGGTGRTFADMAWRVRCLEQPGCDITTPIPDRRVRSFNGDDGNTVICDVSESDGARLLNFTLSDGSGVLEVFGAQIQGDCSAESCGVTAGGACRVEVIEGPNRFVGDACTPGAPTESQPCSIRDVRFCIDSGGFTAVFGEMRCENMEEDSSPAIMRELTGPGDGAADRGSYLDIDLRSCGGLSRANLEDC